MANTLITMIKGDSTLINNTEILEGQVLFNETDKIILLDSNGARVVFCGNTDANPNIAFIEDDDTSSRGYSEGSYIVWKGKLYKVISQINGGDAFVINTNITADTVGVELTALKNTLTASDNLVFKFSKENGTNRYGYLDINGNFVPFRTVHTATKTINTVGTTDMGEYHEYRYVKTENLMNIPTATKTITANGNNQDVLNYAKVNVNVPNNPIIKIINGFGDVCNLGGTYSTDQIWVSKATAGGTFSVGTTQVTFSLYTDYTIVIFDTNFVHKCVHGTATIGKKQSYTVQLGGTYTASKIGVGNTSTSRVNAVGSSYVTLYNDSGGYDLATSWSIVVFK